MKTKSQQRWTPPQPMNRRYLQNDAELRIPCGSLAALGSIMIDIQTAGRLPATSFLEL